MKTSATKRLEKKKISKRRENVSKKKSSTPTCQAEKAEQNERHFCQERKGQQWLFMIFLLKKIGMSDVFVLQLELLTRKENKILVKLKEYSQRGKTNCSGLVIFSFKQKEMSRDNSVTCKRYNTVSITLLSRVNNLFFWKLNGFLFGD